MRAHPPQLIRTALLVMPTEYSAANLVVDEVGADVFSCPKDPTGKLVLLQEWLYGKNQSTIVFR